MSDNNRKDIDGDKQEQKSSNDLLDQQTPDTMAEATTKPLSDDALGGHATQDDVD